MTEQVDSAPTHGTDLEFEGRSATVQRLRSGDMRPSYSVIEAVTQVTGTDPMELGPLYHAIDPDALDRLFGRSGDRSRPDSNGHLAFRYEGCDVTVHADGRTIASKSDSGSPSQCGDRSDR